MARGVPAGGENALQVSAVQQLVAESSSRSRKSRGGQTCSLAPAVESREAPVCPASAQVSYHLNDSFLTNESPRFFKLTSHPFFSRTHNPSALVVLPTKMISAGRAGPASGNGTNVRFLGPTRTSSFQQQVTVDARLSRLKLDGALSDRLVVKSEPARPKPQWLGDGAGAAGSISNRDVDDDDDGFEDILQ